MHNITRSRIPTRFKAFLGIMVITGLAISSVGSVMASSHREAPFTAGDAKADGTDLYAFRSPDKTDTVTVIANYLPFQEPAGGPNFYGFDDNVLYQIHMDSDGDSKANISYEFKFKTHTINPNTFLYNTGPITSLTDPDFNVRQTYSVWRVESGNRQELGTNLPVPPSNVGPKSTPDYAKLQSEAIRNLAGGNINVFAGQSDDPFFVDLGGTFDLLTIRKVPGNEGEGVDGLRGYNVLSIAMQIPINELTLNRQMPTDPAAKGSVLGFWTTSSRQKTQVLQNNSKVKNNGPWVQVSRLGAPLVNEVVIDLGRKDTWNSSQPMNDAQFAKYVADPELGKLLKALYGIDVPPQGEFGSEEQRDDLIAIFLTGIPGLTQPAKVKPSEQLRLNVAVMPTASPERLGVLAGDNQGYPNGRRLADDVTDISLQAVAGAAYPLFHPEFTPDPLAGKLGDGVDTNEVEFRHSFPYLALPHSGFESMPHTNAGITAKVSAAFKQTVAWTDNAVTNMGTAFSRMGKAVGNAVRSI